MNGPEMIEIEATARNALNDPLRHEATFVHIKGGGGGQPKLIARTPDAGSM